MNLFNKLTIKSMKMNRKRTIMTVIGIMLSVALLTAVATMFFSAKSSIILFQKQEQGNYHYGFVSVPFEELEKIKQHRRLEAIWVTHPLGYAKLSDEIETPSKPYAYVKEYTLDALKNLAVNLTSGRYPQKNNELVIPNSLRGNGGLKYNVGDMITLEIGTRVSLSDGNILNQYDILNEKGEEQLINTQTKTYTIVGIMESYPHRLEGYDAPGYTFISYLEDENSIQTADIYIRYTKDSLRNHYGITAQILDIDEDAFDTLMRDDAARIPYEEYIKLHEKISNPKYDYTLNEYLLTLESGVLGNATITALAAAAVLVVFIIIGTSVFCIKNSFDISITEKIRQYGMLASIGATKKQIRKNVYYEAFLLGIAGIPLGILSGMFAAYLLVAVSNQMVSDFLGYGLVFTFSWIAILFSILLGFVTILLSAQRSARKASKIAPILAIRNNTETKIYAKELKSPKWVKKMFGIGGEVAYKNLQRSKRKYRATVISIVICVSIFIGLSSFVTMLFRVLHTEFNEISYNIQVLYSEPEEFYSKMENIRNLDGVQSATTLIRSYLYFEADASTFTEDYKNMFPNAGKESVDEEGNIVKWVEGIEVLVIDDASFQEYAKSLHLNLDETKIQAILVNNFFYELENKKIEMDMYTFQKGDSLDAYTEYYDSHNETMVKIELPKLEITCVTDTFPKYIDSSNLDTGLVVNESFYHLIGESKEHYYTKFLYIDSTQPSQTQDDLEYLFSTWLSGDYYINNLEENAKQTRSFYLLVSIFLYGFITVIALIGVTNIFNTITTNMNLRRREFAMLRSIGMTKKEFNHMIQLESFFYGMKSLLIGIPLGCLLSYAIYKILADGTVVIAYQIPLQAILISAVCVLILITIIMKYLLGKISQQNTIETIRNENI